MRRWTGSRPHGRLRVSDGQRIGQPDSAEARVQVFAVQHAGPLHLVAQRRKQVLRQHGDAILAPLALAHQDLAAFERHILHAQTQAFQDAHPGAVQQRRDEPVRAFQLAQQVAHRALRQHHRQAPRSLGADDLVEPGQFVLQHLLVQEQDGGLGLVLGGRRHLALDRQVGQKGRDLWRAHVARVALATKKNEAARPVDIGLFGTNRIVERADTDTQEVEQLRGRDARWWSDDRPIHPQNFRRPRFSRRCDFCEMFPAEARFGELT